jgi:hypothetical protein
MGGVSAHAGKLMSTTLESAIRRKRRRITSPYATIDLEAHFHALDDWVDMKYPKNGAT